MSVVEDYLRLVRPQDYEEEEQREKAIQETADAVRESIHVREDLVKAPLKKLAFETALTKAVITECVTRLYMDSLIIENAAQYTASLRDVAHKELISDMAQAKSVAELKAMFENTSPYVQAMFPLAEAICDKKEDVDAKAFDNKIILNKDDLDMISRFEKEQGKDVYAGALQDRIIKVYKAEQDLSQKNKDKVQKVVDALSECGDSLKESVESGVSMFDAIPKTIFSAIFMNKSRHALSEAGTGVDISAQAEDVLTETICTYTLLECINALGITNYTDEEKVRLKCMFASN